MSIGKSTFVILLGAIILFVWNAISWTSLPFHGNALATLPDTLIDQLNTNLPEVESGVYHYPGLPANLVDVKTIEHKLHTKPRVTLMVIKSPPSALLDMGQYLKSFVINLLTSTLLFLVLKPFSELSRSSMLKISILIGLIIGMTSDLAQMNWFHFPWSYTLLTVLDHLIGFSLLGLLFGKMLTQKAPQKSSL